MAGQNAKAAQRRGMRGTFETIRAEALFASAVQPSESPSADEVRRAVATTLRRLGVRGCAGHLAGEFGDHPAAAAARMTWALATVRLVYRAPATVPVGNPRDLAMAG